MSEQQEPFDVTGAPTPESNVLRFPPQFSTVTLDDLAPEIEAARAEYERETDEHAAMLASQAIELGGGQKDQSGLDYAFEILARAAELINETDLVVKAARILGPPRGTPEPGDAA